MKPSNIILWGINKLFLFKLAKFIRDIQPINCYTLRGFRFSKQKFIKKVGKISKYMDFKKNYYNLVIYINIIDKFKIIKLINLFYKNIFILFNIKIFINI